MKKYIIYLCLMLIASITTQAQITINAATSAEYVQFVLVVDGQQINSTTHPGWGNWTSQKYLNFSTIDDLRAFVVSKGVILETSKTVCFRARGKSKNCRGANCVGPWSLNLRCFELSKDTGDDLQAIVTAEDSTITVITNVSPTGENIYSVSANIPELTIIANPDSTITLDTICVPTCDVTDNLAFRLDTIDPGGCDLEIAPGQLADNVNDTTAIPATTLLLDSGGTLAEINESFDTISVSETAQGPTLTVIDNNLQINIPAQHYTVSDVTNVDPGPNIPITTTGVIDLGISPVMSITNPSDVYDMIGRMSISPYFTTLERQGAITQFRVYFIEDGVESLIVTRRRWYNGSGFRRDAFPVYIDIPNLVIPPGTTKDFQFRLEVNAIAVPAAGGNLDAASTRMTFLGSTTAN